MDMQKSYCRGLLITIILVLAGFSSGLHAADEMIINAPLQEADSVSGTVTFTFELEDAAQGEVAQKTSPVAQSGITVPEPSTVILVGLGLLGGLGLLKREQKC